MASNPYLADQAGAITNQVNQNLQNNILPGINQGAIAAGGFGGSRQGIAQGLAIGQTNQGLSNSLANLYGSAYDADQNRATQTNIANMQNQTQRDLGFGNLGLGYYSAANNYDLGSRAADTSQFNADTSRGLGYGGLGLQANQNNFNNALNGYNAQLNGLNSMMNWNNLGLGWANQQAQQPIQNLTNLSNIGTSIGGQGGTVSTPYQGNPWLGALGGAQLFGSMFKTPGG